MLCSFAALLLLCSSLPSHPKIIKARVLRFPSQNFLHQLSKFFFRYLVAISRRSESSQFSVALGKMHRLGLVLCWMTSLFTVLALAAEDHRPTIQARDSSSSRVDYVFASANRMLSSRSRQLSSSSSIASPGSIGLTKRGIPGLPGDVEWMAFYGALISIPTLISVMAMQTHYNVQKSYYNSKIAAQYYQINRDLTKFHESKLIKQQERLFASAGKSWKGMLYDKDGNLNQGVKYDGPLMKQGQGDLAWTLADPKTAGVSAPKVAP